MMAIHYNAFRDELYREHLEEGGFQYDTRCEWLIDNEIGWQELQDIDLTLEAHIDALVVGGAIALKTCLEAQPDADPGMLHVIVRLYCRHQLIDRLARLWPDFDFSDQTKVRAVADALKWECPKGWLPSLLNVFKQGKPEMFTTLAPCVASVSPESAATILEAFPRCPADQQENLLHTVARCQITALEQSKDLLESIKAEKNDPLFGEKHLCLALAGEMPRANTLLLASSRPELIAVTAGMQDVKALLALVSQSTPNSDQLFALGLAGNLEAVPLLLGLLDNEELALTAAHSLHLITGAPLFEDVYQEDEVEEADLFDFELDAFKRGELPKNIDGLPFGVEVRQISCKKEAWSNWLENNKTSFTRGLRYRFGKLFSPASLLECLVSNQFSRPVRYWSMQELRIRYRMDLPFSEDNVVKRQKQQLNQINEWLHSLGGIYASGQWH